MRFSLANPDAQEKPSIYFNDDERRKPVLILMLYADVKSPYSQLKEFSMLYL